MWDAVVRCICALIAVVLFVVAFVGSEGLSDDSIESAMLPPCTVEQGLPLIQDDEVTCYWGMSMEIVNLPSEVDLAEVSVEITWDKSGVWIGVAEAAEAAKCTEKDGYYECEKSSVDLIAGGEGADGQFTWKASSGEYRFVAGGEDAQTLQQFDVEWTYEASLPKTTAWPLVMAGVLFGLAAVLGWQRIFDRVIDFF